MKQILAALGVLFLTLATAAPALASVRSVAVGSFYFEDSSVGDGKVVIDEGDQITFTFQGNAQHTATVTGLFDSGRKSGGQTYTTGALSRAGTYTLMCTVHGASRHSSTLVIRAAAAPPPSDPPPPPPPSSEPASSPTPTKTASTTTSSGRGTSSGSGSGTTSGTGGATTGTTTGTTTAKPKPAATSALPPTAKTTSGPSAVASSAGPLVPTGDGSAAAEALADVPVIPGSLTDVLGREPAKEGSWTRSVLLAGLMLLPMLGAAGWALRRRPRDPE